MKITTFLLYKLEVFGVKVILCNDKHNPSSEIVTYNSNINQTKNITKQIKWKSSFKRKLWQNIVRMKISMQKQVMEVNSIKYSKKMDNFIDNVCLGDETNMEGQASRLYFKSLFGSSFKRHSDDNINSALNYGYSLIISLINKYVVLYGYLTNIGIKHCSGQNSFNLSYDLIEPFRALIDLVVYENQDKMFDNDYKKTLLKVIYSDVFYNLKKYQVIDAIKYFTNDCLTSLSENKITIKKVSLL